MVIGEEHGVEIAALWGSAGAVDFDQKRDEYRWFEIVSVCVCAHKAPYVPLDMYSTQQHAE